jgi:hypothetical protein
LLVSAYKVWVGSSSLIVTIHRSFVRSSSRSSSPTQGADGKRSNRTESVLDQSGLFVCVGPCDDFVNVSTYDDIIM